MHFFFGIEAESWLEGVWECAQQLISVGMAQRHLEYMYSTARDGTLF